MKKINIGDTVVLLMDINEYEAPFFAKVGHSFTALDVTIDPYMPSGYAVAIEGFGPRVNIDKSAVVHLDDWKNIHNAVLRNMYHIGKLRWKIS